MFCQFNTNISYLEDLVKEDLLAWLKGCLLTGDTAPIYISPGEDDLGEAVVDIFKGLSETSKSRFKGVVEELVNGWSQERHTLDYLSKAAVLSARTGAVGAYSCLLVHAYAGQLKGRVDKNGVDVHQTVLRVIWGMLGTVNRLAQHNEDINIKFLGVKALSKSLFERDIDDPRYSRLCHNALYGPQSEL